MLIFLCSGKVAVGSIVRIWIECKFPFILMRIGGDWWGADLSTHPSTAQNTVFSTVYSLQFKVYNVQFKIAQCSVYSVHCRIQSWSPHPSECCTRGVGSGFTFVTAESRENRAVGHWDCRQARELQSARCCTTYLHGAAVQWMCSAVQCDNVVFSVV